MYNNKEHHINKSLDRSHSFSDVQEWDLSPIRRTSHGKIQEKFNWKAI